MKTGGSRYTRYRWVVLALAVLSSACIFWSWWLVPSLAYSLFPAFNLTHTQFTLLFTAPVIVGTFTPLLGGMLTDRYGMKFTLTISIFMAGAIGLARAYAPSFEVLLLLMFLLGVPAGFTWSNISKLVGVWFPPRERGLASGIMLAGYGCGTSLGLLTAPLFGSWKPAFTNIGIIALVAAVLWAVFGRDNPKGVEVHMPPLAASVKKSVKSKNIWAAAGALFLVDGGIIAYMATFPNALEAAHGVDPAAAGATASLLSWGQVVGNVFLPMLSDRIGFRKPVLYASIGASAVCFFYTWHLAPGNATPILSFVSGLLLGGAFPLTFASVAELPEIGHAYAGGASGLVASIMRAGGFLLPLLVVTPLIAAETSASGYANSFLAASILIGAGLIPLIFLKETGTSSKARGTAPPSTEF